MLAPVRIAGLAGVCALLATTAFAEPEERKLSKLAGVEMSQSPETVVVKLKGTRPPDFTTFTLENPFRVVVDWSGSVLGDDKHQFAFDGLVRKASLQQFDSESERISRVTLHLAARTTYELVADGNNVVVKLAAVPAEALKPKPEPVVAAVVEKVKEDLPVPPAAQGPLTERAVAIPAEAPAVAVIAKQAPAPKPQPPVKKVAPPAPKPVKIAKVAPKPKKVAPPKVEAAAPVIAKAAPKPQPKPAKIRTPAPAPKVAAVEPSLPLTEPATEVPTEVVLAKTEVVPEPPKATVVAKAKPAPKPAPAPVAKPVEEPKKLAAFVPPAKPKPAPAPVAKPTPAPRKLASFAPPAAPKPRRLASTGGGSWSPPGIAAPVRGIAQDTPIEPTGSTEMPEGNESDDDYDPGPRIMKYIGFRQMAATSRVFVRVDGKARYRTYTGPGSFVVELLDTRVNVKNNTRPLDTSYFNSPVSRVQAVEDGSSTRIEVKLREGAPAKIKRIGTTLAIDFTRG